MRKVGILVNDLGNGQLASQAIASVNKYLGTRNDASFIFFYLNLAPVISTPLCPMMHAAEAFCFDGEMIATSVNTASRLADLPGPKKKFYYVWDLEWIRPQPVHYDWVKIPFLSDKLKLISRCKDHADIIGNCFNRRPSAYVPDFDIEKLLEAMK